MSDSCCGTKKEEIKKNEQVASASSVVSTFKVSGMDCADEIDAVLGQNHIQALSHRGL